MMWNPALFWGGDRTGKRKKENRLSFVWQIIHDLPSFVSYLSCDILETAILLSQGFFVSMYHGDHRSASFVLKVGVTQSNLDFFIKVRLVYSTYWLCMIQRVLMKPFLDHLNCNRDKLGWVTKQQWAVYLKGQTDNYWSFHIICLISLSDQADSPYSPSRLICPNISLWSSRTPPHTCTLIHTHTWTHARAYSHQARNSLGIFLSPLRRPHPESPCVCSAPTLL